MRVGPGETITLADVDGPGLITHFYAALALCDPFDFRDAVIRMYWDGEELPSVEVPLGDFFCLPHCRVRDFRSALVTVNPGMPGSHGMNAYFPMPFTDGARITLTHEGTAVLGGVIGALWYHIDCEELDEPPGEEVGRFHAQWRREVTTRSIDEKVTNRQLWAGSNLTGEENYAMLEAEGRGQVVGINLQVDNVAGGWWGEGDDMWFIDDEAWPPSVHGTGTEEVFGGGACPDTEYAGPYSGFHLIEHLGSASWAGKSAMYRWFVTDPVRFSRSVRATIEHGHANNFENDYTSVAYWYQTEPHLPFGALPSAAERWPRMPEGFDELRARLAALAGTAIASVTSRTPAGQAPPPAEIEAAMRRVGEAFECVYQGDFAAATLIADKLAGGE